MFLPIGTKYSLPPLRTNLILRTQLLQKFDRARSMPLTLVVAAAGFGKSKLVRAWCGQHESQSAWLSLDEEDNDPARFIAYLIAALQRIPPNLSTLAASVPAGSTPALYTLFAELVNTLQDCDDFWLVLDGYHLSKTKDCILRSSFGLTICP